MRHDSTARFSKAARNAAQVAYVKGIGALQCHGELSEPDSRTHKSRPLRSHLTCRGASHDAGNLPGNWFWVLSYLAGKALHHTISSAAVLLLWHRRILEDARESLDHKMEGRNRPVRQALHSADYFRPLDVGAAAGGMPA